ncbi:ClpXP protease specificity-enhancing factor SspB [Guyparkeria hydrothermalis]|uniref:stringent starvation protein B n=1 Tax=Guyparkeria hydrothermalis TaxID=923 RepID=UPI002020CB51|nr:ClpXP protease specificity-enhancing factor SspB [Guyparkeria hydrothermalis]MCL7743939.1 ClpXP protease specificity-enhancing factor SspB [Guyparkeria hydrothermalis]
MLSKRPYLIPAFYDWIVDQGHVPHLVVNAHAEGVMVPTVFVEDGHIQLNIGPNAVRDFYMDRVAISFEARFAGQPEQVYVPMHAVKAIVDRDSGQGATFSDEPEETFPQSDDVGAGSTEAPTTGRKGRPQLRAVRGNEEAGSDPEISKRDGKPDDGGPDDDPPPGGGGGGKGGPSLRVVK